MDRPRHVYINWSAYDELSDTVELVESIATKQLDEVLRLRTLGVQIDAYVMDAFWYEPDSRYREFRRRSWSRGGGESWIDRCLGQGITPGLWFGCNSLGLSKVHGHPAWQESLTANGREACWFAGSFCDDFFAAMAEWYGRGVRVFKLDFFSDQAVPPSLEPHMTVREVQQANRDAFWRAARRFRAEHPEVVLMGYNGYEDKCMQFQTDLPVRKHIDRRWYDVFDTLYCGDPRPSDVPCHNFWRSKDVYSDHMVHFYHLQGIPLSLVDNAGFMIGTTGTCYWRGTASWKPMLLLALARGSGSTTYYGDLSLLDGSDAVWMAEAQGIYDRFHAMGCEVKLLGGVPGQGEPYGYVVGEGPDGLCTVVNPSQSVVSVDLPFAGDWRVLFADAGHEARVSGGRVVLGPEQMAVVASGRDLPETLGRNMDIVVPVGIRSVDANMKRIGRNTVCAEQVWPGGVLRAIVRQRVGGVARRTSSDWEGTRQPVDRLISLKVEQGGRDVQLVCNYDKKVWAGMSWGVVETMPGALVAGKPVTVTASSQELVRVDLELSLYSVDP